MQKPILVLQMQRMGDLILSFPLLGLLQKKYPQTPIWTVAEEAFFSEFYGLAPQTVFFPPTAASNLQTQAYKMVINLSHREDAARLAGQVQADQRFGAYIQGNTPYIGGDWPLYRASIVHNNSSNLFHWSDLYLLEHLDKEKIPPWKASLPIEQKEKTVGIFVGASEKEKRPSASFFAKLAKSLARKDYRVLFLGGPNDIPIAEEATRLSGLKGASLCGKFSLEQLAITLKKLTLFITPDTGPMHLAAWINTPILNISLGPVNPWETGPRSKQHAESGQKIHLSAHHIVQPAIDCSGCWKACLGTQRCQELLHPERIALLAHAIMQSSPENDLLQRIELPGLNVYKTGNDDLGRYNLVPLKNITQSNRFMVGRFWQEWFWQRLQKQESSAAKQEFKRICNDNAHLADIMRHGILQLGSVMRKQLKISIKNRGHALPSSLWKYFPAPIHALSGYTHLYLQNNEYSLSAWERVLSDMEELYKII